MTREEAKREMKECEGVEECSMRFTIIDKIYDSFESRTCESCINSQEYYKGFASYGCKKLNMLITSEWYCAYWEAKEKR